MSSKATQAYISEYLRGLGLTSRGLLQGAGQTADMLATPVAGLLNLPVMAAGGKPMFQANPTESTANSLSDAIGLPRPENTTEELLNIPAQVLGGSAMPIGKGLSLTGELLEQVAKSRYGQGFLRSQPVGELVDAATGSKVATKAPESLPTAFSLEGSRLLPRHVRESHEVLPLEGKNVYTTHHAFNSEGDKFLVEFKADRAKKAGEEVSVTFSRYDPKRELWDFKLLGDTKRPSEVMANVVSSVRDYLRTNKPSTVFIEAARKDKNRTKVYESLVKKYLTDGYDYEVLDRPNEAYNLIKLTLK